MDTTIKLYRYNYRTLKTYLFAAFFIVGNIIFPQLAHSIPNGGLIFLPIYFFTLIGAYKYGLTVGLLTAVFSPLLNSWIFGMPPVGMLPIIITKSVLLAIGAAYVASKSQKVSFLGLLMAILFYQLTGLLFEWLYTGSLILAYQDLRMGFPGLLLQWLGGFALLKFIQKM